MYNVYGAYVSKSVRNAFLIFLTLAVCGCAVGPDYEKPSVPPPPGGWMDSGDDRISENAPDYGRWWTMLGDPVLDSLIETACAQNLTLRAAGIRVLEARAQRLIAVGSFFPQTQEATAGYSRNLLSENLHPGTGFSNSDKGLVSRTFNLWSAGFDAAWELDFWGKFRRAIESASASLDASVFDYGDVLVTLTAEVAATYVQVRGFEERLRVARENVDIQKETLELTKTRFKYGAVTELDVEQARANLADTEATLPQLEAGLRRTRNALCTLLGVPPGELRDMLAGKGEIPAAPPRLAAGIPADLLRRRPDVRRAEREIAAECAKIGVAAADLYPHVVLKGSIGVEAEDFNDLWQDLSLAGAAGPSVRWQILNYGRIVNRARARNARTQELVANYRNTVLKAYEEAESAITAFLREQERKARLSESVTAAKRSVDLSLLQYREGAADFTRVLNSETFLAGQQDALIRSRVSIARNLIAINKAIGGGGEALSGKGFVPAETRESMGARFGWARGWWPRFSPGWPFTLLTGKGAGLADAAEPKGGTERAAIGNVVFQRVPVVVSGSAD